MARFDSNSVLLLIFFIFFVVLPGEDPNKDNLPSSEYERRQLTMINDLYKNEFENLRKLDYKQPLLNITGFLYTLDDLEVNKNDYNTNLISNNTSNNWFGYPIENKNYDYTFDIKEQSNNYLPQNLLNRIFSDGDSSIWKDNSDTYIYQSNVSSTTLRGLFYSRNIQDEDKVHMPIPQFMKHKNESKDANGEEQILPDRGSFFINDTTLFEQSMNINSTDSNLINMDISTTVKLEINDFFNYPGLKPGSLQFHSAELSKSSARFTSLISKLLIVYDSQTGRLFGITNSGKFHGMLMIPQLFSNNENEFNRYKEDTISFVNHTYFEGNKRSNNTFTIDDILILNERSSNPEFLLYAQTKPVSERPADKNKILNTVDLNNLYGKDHNLLIEDMLIYSPNFGLSLETASSNEILAKKNFKGVLGSLFPIYLQESTMKYVTLPFILYSIVFLMQISKLDSPSELNKISIDFLKFITFTDCFVGGVFIVLGIVVTTYSDLTPNVSLHYADYLTKPIVNSFVKVKDIIVNGNDNLVYDLSKNIRTTQFSWFAVNVVLFMGMGIAIEAKVLVLCIQSQFLERSISWLSLFRRFTPMSVTTRTSQEEHAATSEPNTNPTGENNEPTSEPNEENNFLINNTEGSEDFTFLYSKIQGRIYTFMVLFAFAIVFIYSMNIFLRHLICNLVVLVYTSLFWSQISRFILIDLDPMTTNLQSRFVIVTGLTRLIPIGYFYLNENNFFQHQTDINWFIVYCINITVQVVLLLIQLKYGGRSIISDKLERVIEFILSNGSKSIKHRYNYSKSVTKEQLTHLGEKNEFICPICMDNDDIIHLKVEDQTSSTEEADTEETQLLEEINVGNDHVESYMITPCNHVYHHDCLSYWMNNKLICPVCRNNLPPL